MAFYQQAPSLPDQYSDDRVLRSYLRRALPEGVLREVTPSLEAMGALASGELLRLQALDRGREPVHTPWDPWGNRVDDIEVTPLWRRAAEVAATHGVVATAYERAHGALSRVHQFALVYLFSPSTDVYSCPLAMTDGAARTLLAHGNRALLERALPRLTSRDPSLAWTSGQWMTERTGGSDVGLSETVARERDGAWTLHGTKWFSSATTSDMALTLGRPEGNPPGGRGLALFYLELRDEQGRLRNIQVNRLKDKLGTRKVPTAELTLDGTPALLVAGTTDGVKNITPMLTLTRTWNAVCAISGMRRALALARDYARRRVAFGATLDKKPLHGDTLASLQAEFEAGFQLTFRVVELLGRDETGSLSEREAELLRILTPLVKLTTGKQAVAVASEVLEAFGGAGYVEDTGLPTLLRDAQVLPIWEGTTNVLSLDVLRVLARGDALGALLSDAEALASGVRDPALRGAVTTARSALANARSWAEANLGRPDALEAGARRFCLTLGRAYALVLLCVQAQWSLDREGDARSRAAALRFAHLGVECLGDGALSLEDALALADDRPLGAVTAQ
ncbi:MAG: acyl-CoA dehydrogenase family protein [Deltaproteobacteria bacterium]|nr:acyl-CoA dehydrogenase family protein [Deltaproteobacteria bacterium]